MGTIKRPTKEEIEQFCVHLNSQTVLLDRDKSWTICEVLRHIWKAAEGAPNETEIKELVAEATVYAKRMSKKLEDYKKVK